MAEPVPKPAPPVPGHPKGLQRHLVLVYLLRSRGLRALLSAAREFSQREKWLNIPFPNQPCHQPPPAFPH